MSIDIDALRPHPLALLYDRDEEGLLALASSIAVEGVREEVVVMNGQIVDGNRRTVGYQMAVANGAKPPGGFRWRSFDPKKDGDVWDFILSRNIRRDRPRGQKAVPILREDLKRNYGKSDRSIALRTGCHHTIVRDERAKMEEAGEIPATPGRVDERGRVHVVKAKGEAPPDAGDSWEKPPEGSPEAATDKAVKEAAQAGFDRLGNPLPGHLKDAFADSFYEDLADSLAWMTRHVEAGPKIYCRLHLKPADAPFAKRLRDFSQWASSVLEHHAPHCVCPHCEGREGGCERCFGSGWLSRGQYEEALERPE